MSIFLTAEKTLNRDGATGPYFAPNIFPLYMSIIQIPRNRRIQTEVYKVYFKFYPKEQYHSVFNASWHSVQKRKEKNIPAHTVSGASLKAAR